VQLFALNRAKSANDWGAPGWGIHLLSGERSGHWAIKVDANWRLTFMFEGEDAIQVDYQHYH
jgi:proteic killer suppression protein